MTATATTPCPKGFYACEHCRGVFRNPEDWTTEDKLAEEKAAFGKNSAEDERVVLCDNCYQLVMAEWRKLS